MSEFMLGFLAASVLAFIVGLLLADGHAVQSEKANEEIFRLKCQIERLKFGSSGR